ncbi:YppG family protein [Metabacillus sp. KIGAM252]|uniref:YppG family protein n=1 Tax=Metabacillus flavus TaxID=2823519 RepID=A0ABS5LG48_9BACI|nr:YppG family protein [Metabacillus flavus]MBS2969364.1 YppG family protein [Metabacillus flavus]
MFYPYGPEGSEAHSPRVKRRRTSREASWGSQIPVYQQHAYPYEAYQQANPYYNQQLYQYQPVQPTLPYLQNLAQYTPNTAFQPQSPYPYPYPKQGPFPKQPQGSGMQNVMSQFKKSNGQYDYNKMMDTAGQMMSAVNQMSSLFKGVTGFFK